MSNFVGVGLRRLGLGLLLLVILTAAGSWLISTLRQRSLEWCALQGLDMLRDARTPETSRDALVRWERLASEVLTERRLEFLRSLGESPAALDEPRRRLFSWAARAQFQSTADWRRHLDSLRAASAGKPISAPPGERVRLTRRWSAPVGQTGRFSAILPRGDAVFVASLGEVAFDSADTADGLVRVGNDAPAESWFQPPGSAPSDAIGFAALDDLFIVATAGGRLHAVDVERKVRWSASVGAQIRSQPLVLAQAGRQSGRVLLLDADGRLRAYNARDGGALWSAALGLRKEPARTEADWIDATLLALPADERGPAIVIVHTADAVSAIAANDGRLLWKLRGAGAATAPVLSGRTLYERSADGGLRAIRVGHAPPTPATIDIASEWSLGEAVAGLRTLRAATAGAADGVLVTTRGDSNAPGALTLFRDENIEWSMAPGGLIIATPAVADLSGDHRAEIIVATINADDTGRGELVVLTATGHVVLRVALDAASECAPVVADLDQDGANEVLVADRAGFLHCFASGRAGPIDWGLLHGDPHNTRSSESAFAYSQLPAPLQSSWRP